MWERYYRAKMIESMEYRAIGSWWDPKGYIDSKGNHQQCEIDIIAVLEDDKNVDIIEVKRNADKYSPKLMEEKVDFLLSKEKRLRRYKRMVKCLSLADV